MPSSSLFPFLLVSSLFFHSTSEGNLNNAASNVLQIRYERKFIVSNTILSVVRVCKISRDEKLVRSTDSKGQRVTRNNYKSGTLCTVGRMRKERQVSGVEASRTEYMYTRRGRRLLPLISRQSKLA